MTSPDAAAPLAERLRDEAKEVRETVRMNRGWAKCGQRPELFEEAADQLDTLAAQLRDQQETIKEIALAVRNPALTDLACRSAVGVLTTDQTLTEEDIRRGREVAEMIRTRRVAATIAQAHAIDESVRQRYVAEIAEQRDRAESLAAQLRAQQETIRDLKSHSARCARCATWTCGYCGVHDPDGTWICEQCRGAGPLANANAKAESLAAQLARCREALQEIVAWLKPGPCGQHACDGCLCEMQLAHDLAVKALGPRE